MYVLEDETGLEMAMLIYHRFIEENNAYKNEQKEIQRNQRMPPGMPSQELMMYWGMKPLFFVLIY